jgi:hypothetical protein
MSDVVSTFLSDFQADPSTGAPPERLGNKFLPVPAKFLSYFDMSWGFQIPWAHAGLLRAVKSFWQLVLGKYGNEPKGYHILFSGRKLMTSRAAFIHCTHEAGRAYTDICSTMGSWTMEDWLHWTETYSLYIARGMLPPLLEKAWQNLRKAVLHYCNDRGPYHRTTAAKRMQRHFFAAELLYI